MATKLQDTAKNVYKNPKTFIVYQAEQTSLYTAILENTVILPEASFVVVVTTAGVKTIKFSLVAGTWAQATQISNPPA